MWNKPEDCPTGELDRLLDDGALLNAETIFSDKPRARLAPEKPEGVPIYFADDVPMEKLWQWLGGFGLQIGRSIRTGNLVAKLTPEARAKIEAEIAAQRPSELSRQRSTVSER